MSSNSADLKQRVTALEAMVKELASRPNGQPDPRDPYAHADGSRECRPVEPQPEPIDPDLAEAREIVIAAAEHTPWQTILIRRGEDGLALVAIALAALKSRPKPSGDVVAYEITMKGTKYTVLFPELRRLIKGGARLEDITSPYAAPPPAKPRLLTVEEVRSVMPGVFHADQWPYVVARLNAILQGETK